MAERQRAVELETDCSVSPWAKGCRPPSMMDMIDAAETRAKSNAEAQKKVKEALLRQQRKQRAELRLKEKREGRVQDLASTDYGGMDIASPDSVQHQLHRSMLKGGRTAVEARVAQLRDQILADAGNLMDYGQKVGKVKPPAGIAKLS